MDSFDKYTVQTGADVATEMGRFGWQNTGTDFQIEAAKTNNGLSINSNVSLQTPTLSPNSNVGYVGFHYKVDTMSSDNDFIRIREGSITHLAFDTIGGTGLIEANRSTSTILGTTSSGIIAGTWAFIEIKWTIHNTTGTIDIKIDGTNVLSLSGIDTQNGGTAAWDNIWLMGQNASVDNHYDNFYVLDDLSSGVTGAPNNDFLGEVFIEAIFPDGNGSSSQLTGQDADSTNNYLNVDDNPGPDDDSTYNGSATASDEDDYTMGALSAITVDDIRAIQVSNVCRTESGNRDMRNIIRHSAVTYYGTARTMGTTFAGETDIAEGANPFAGSTQWTIANVNAIGAGFEVNT
jgi:hypothetical protein